MTLFPLLLTLAAATPPAASDEARTIRTIELDERSATRVYRVRTSVGLNALIEFPEEFELPVACGDCAVEPPADASPEAVAEFHNTRALFALVPEPERRYLTIRPLQHPTSVGGPIPDLDFLTTVTVRLKSRVTITLQVEYAPKAQADARLVFTLPNRGNETAFVRDAIAKEREALEAAYAQRVEAGALQALLNALLEPHQCVESSGRARQDNLVVEVLELCRFGSRLFVRFRVENRSRQTVTLGDSAVRAALGGAEPVELAQLGIRYTAEQLAFQASAVGVAAADLGDPGVTLGTIQLVVTERGGKGRSLSVTQLDF